MDKYLIIALIIAASLFTAPPKAAATLEIQLSELSGPSLTIVDNGAGDTNPAIGQISTAANLVFGDFTLSGISATSDHSPSLGLLSSASLSVKNNSATNQVIDVLVGDTDFPASGTPLISLASSASGTFAIVPETPATTVANGEVALETFVDPSNRQFLGVLADEFQMFTPDATLASYSHSNVYNFAPSAPYSLTLRDSFDLAGNTQVVGFAHAVTMQSIPEPDMLGLFACGLLSLAGISRRRSLVS